jgi:hypothetical protein
MPPPTLSSCLLPSGRLSSPRLAAYWEARYRDALSRLAAADEAKRKAEEAKRQAEDRAEVAERRMRCLSRRMDKIVAEQGRLMEEEAA